MTNRNTKRREGSVLVCVLVCLAIATSLVAATLRTALLNRREMRTQLRVRQAELLLDAGVQRAAQRIRGDAEYPGETWALAPGTLPGAETATVEIAVAPATEDSPPVVRVVARLAAAEHAAVQRSYTFPLSQ